MTPDQLKRFMSKVQRAESPDGCWMWTGSKVKGYGRVWIDGKMRMAHSISYEHFIGPIPEELEPDHLCRVRACCNYKHLELVTHRENVLRGDAITKVHALKTHCIHGHPFTKENTYVFVHPSRKGFVMRTCRICRLNRDRRRYRRRTEQRRLKNDKGIN